MEIVETSVFTKQIRSLLKDDEYKELQERLVINPLAGAVIRGSGGLRKVRWAVEGRGKSGGLQQRNQRGSDRQRSRSFKEAGERGTSMNSQLYRDLSNSTVTDLS
jgi:hypothetical protein